MTPARKRILFVDDEPAVLGGLENLLRKDRQRWELLFAVGAENALEEMKKAPVDVVVSDMCMPRMDGAALLAKVKADYPTTARLVLSGHAERELVLRALPVAHQYLSKPCEVTVLRVAIERTCELHRLLEDDAIRRAIGKLERLPSGSQTYAALTEVASDPRAGIADVAAIVQRDPAMSVKVLQLVNSAYFGCAQRVVSIQDALRYLGIELVKGLSLTAHVFDMLEMKAVPGFSVEKLQSHSILTARIAKRLIDDPRRGEEAFTAALVHDVGKMIIATGFPEQFGQIVREVRETGKPFHDVEKEIVGVTHAEVGAYLLGVWGLPFSIVESVAFHHRPRSVSAGPCDVIAAVHLADALVKAAETETEPQFDHELVGRANLQGKLSSWRTIVQTEIWNAERVA